MRDHINTPQILENNQTFENLNKYIQASDQDIRS